MQKKFKATRIALRVLSGLSLFSLALTGHAAMSGVELVNNTDWVMGGAPNMRDTGVGTINLNSPSLVSGASISKAYLYWAGPTSNASDTANASVLFNSEEVIGTNIGFSHDNNWEYANSQAYRADVTSKIFGLAAGLNTFSLANFIKGPFDENTGAPEVNVNGASLLILFNDGNSLNDRDLLIFGGNDSNVASGYDGYGWGVTVNGVQWSGSPNAYLHLGVSDGQQSLVDDTLTLNGNPLPGASWGGDSILGGSPTFGLWDLASWNISSLMTPGSNDLTLFTGVAKAGFDPLNPESPLYDYTSLIHGFIDLPADSYAVPEPTTVISGLVFAGLFGARLLRRRR